MNNNKAWVRPNNSPNMLNQNSIQPQLMNQAATALGHMGTGMVQFQQQQHQVFQNNMQQNLQNLGLQQMANNALSAATLNSQIASNPIFQQVTYPNTRGLNPTAFQSNLTQVAAVPNNSAPGVKQRVLTGKVTQIHDNFGLVDEEVIFQMNTCVKGSHPVVGDRVLVEAQFTPNLHFKWSATRVQVLHVNKPSSSRHSNNNSKSYGNSSVYNAVPPPEPPSFGRNSRQKAVTNRGRERSRERDRDDDEIERKRRREERMREREKEEKKSPVRRRSRSPKSRRRSRIVPRYMVQVPKIALDLSDGDVLEVRRRYSNLYIPSDFFFTNIKWVDSFPPNKPFTLNKPCSFYIMNKEVDPLAENNSVLEPPDADYIFSAKVMLMSVPGVEELYQRCCGIAEDKDKRDRESEERDFVHPTRLINFLVGLRGKNETMAIGGPWSSSLDGENPDTDPSVLIRTAIRTCKALTGIDLSNCTQWYRFVELYYRRSESTHKGRLVPARVETVVLFLPDIWSCLPTRLEWDGLQQSYRKQWENIVSSSAAPADAITAVSSPIEQDEANSGSTAAASADEKEEELLLVKPDPTHYSKLDPKTMNVNELRDELKARNISSKGLKSQLAARLVKALKAEAEKDDETSQDKESEVSENVEEKKSEVEEKEKKMLDDKEKALLEKRHTLPEQPHILVHPSRTAKSGKFDCTVMSLSVLLDYRPEDTKEHSFEVSLFAELFNEMLMRDFGFIIFKTLYELPEKPKEEKKDDKKDRDDKKEKDDRKEKDDKKEKEDKNDKDEKKDKDVRKKDDDKKMDDKSKDKDAEKKHDSDKHEKSKKSDDSTKDDDKRKERDSKRDDRRSDDSDEEDDSEDEKDKKKDKDRKKKERVKLVTKDKHLLLSFIYFDQTHCGYIFDKDIEDLLYTLGLKLSRAQVRKLVSKVVTRDSLHYRKLTDKPKDEVAAETQDVTNLEDLAVGNRNLLPFLDRQGSSTKNNKTDNEGIKKDHQDGLVLFRGSLVDIDKLMTQLERSEKARLDTEARMVDLKSENQRLSEKYTKSSSNIKHLNSEVKEHKDKLRSTEDSLSRITAYSKLFQMTLVDIRDKIDPVLKSTTHKEDVKKEKEDKDKKHEEGKSRWEKEKEKEKEKEREVKKADIDVEMVDSKKDN